ncbi:MAG: bifunctional diaminohydroxyphosphoribosylaminopyrimidine deaminase/5-amino-6-(5-phosphoribosylamino)uracil reductase RibD [Gammaproteobacteria bacterium]|nr:bifunctional diaminohydroxyphosphoribosylaminopyrimidine deaminase/5-amino-6-(5-phosphoribosylamino)uracil reductase RibD [Gammaproteobacteria bacterium]
MGRALELAARGLYTTDPNPRVGCVLVGGGRVVGEGWHRRAGEAHAEVHALAAAGAAARGATAYVTLEPCSHTGRTPPCTEALIAAGVSRVVCAATDPNTRVDGNGVARLRAAGIAVDVGPLEREARALNAGFFSRFERGRPYVRLKLALSLDARTARADGRRAWITGEAARADVQTWRARSGAVLTGAGTVRVDDPRLDVRLDYAAPVRQPLRVVLDPRLSCAPQSRIFAGEGALVFATAGAANRAAGWPAQVRVETLGGDQTGLDLGAALERLAALEVNELLVECGAKLAGSFLRAGLVDELVVYVAPLLLGADAPPLAELRSLAEAMRFEWVDVRRMGEDLRMVLRPKNEDRRCSPES